jgi:hypothetical protein
LYLKKSKVIRTPEVELKPGGRRLFNYATGKEKQIVLIMKIKYLSS